MMPPFIQRESAARHRGKRLEKTEKETEMVGDCAPDNLVKKRKSRDGLVKFFLILRCRFLSLRRMCEDCLRAFCIFLFLIGRSHACPTHFVRAPWRK